MQHTLTRESGETKKLIDKFILTDGVPLHRAKGDLMVEVSLKELLGGVIDTICLGKGASLRGLREIMNYDGEGHYVH